MHDRAPHLVMSVRVALLVRTCRQSQAIAHIRGQQPGFVFGGLDEELSTRGEHFTLRQAANGKEDLFMGGFCRV